MPRVVRMVTELSVGTALFPHGWYGQALAVPSPNCNDRPADPPISLALIHSISLPPGEYGGDAITRLFTNQLDCDEHPYYQGLRGLQVSAHFLIRREGNLLQFVSCERRAWHAGQSMFQGQENCNDFSIGIELEGLEGSGFEAPQYASLAHLLHHLAAAYPIAHVAGHEHVAPGRKRDPGAGFEWVRLAHSLAWPARCFPEGLVLSGDPAA